MPDEQPQHTLVFTGHRVDAPGREEPQFPPEKVELAKAEIEAAIDREIAEHGAENLVAISGAASGGDILFHEACMARGIRNFVYLALPPEQYAETSVNDAGPDWTRRFQALIEARPPRVLQPLPELQKNGELSVWNRNNLWMLARGLAHGGENMTLLALWNGKPGDGPGGTDDMVEQARARGARVVMIGRGTIFTG